MTVRLSEVLPLQSHGVESGLRVRSQIDTRVYARGRRVSDTQLAEGHLEPNAFHAEWNHTIHPADA